jgi:hypothetical protein
VGTYKRRTERCSEKFGGVALKLEITICDLKIEYFGD